MASSTAHSNYHGFLRLYKLNYFSTGNLANTHFSSRWLGIDTVLVRRLGIDSVSAVVRRSRLRWFEHVECKESDDWLSECRSMIVESEKG